MNYVIYIPVGDYVYSFPLLPTSDYQVIDLHDVVHFSIHKRHNHLYEFSCFFYKSKTLYWPRYFKSKKELFGAIQKLLQEELSVDVQ